eukprot:GFUD01094715.1.p2 GENE.GFUD01094715.1~~GFUD01094715.1.p2  ORF type:complete len:158 (-),score=51.49 GFUD01094715.1:444-917(-)
MLSTLIPLLLLSVVQGDMNDVDQADMGSDTSSTSDMDMDLDMHDPNIHNPQQRHGYGIRAQNPKFGQVTTTAKPAQTPKTTKAPTHGEQSVKAVLQFGIIVGVCLMVGAGFMSMVGLEILCDKASDKYREFTKKPKPLPDIERLHPAELVGTFSRYK